MKKKKKGVKKFCLVKWKIEVEPGEDKIKYSGTIVNSQDRVTVSGRILQKKKKKKNG